MRNNLQTSSAIWGRYKTKSINKQATQSPLASDTLVKGKAVCAHHEGM
jgi:hypothetical protein